MTGNADGAIVEALRYVRDKGVPALRVAVVAGILAGALGMAYMLWGQPVRQVTSLEFRPTFEGASAGLYPNGLAFSSTDIISAPVADAVFEVNSLEQYCSRDAFRSGLYVEERSDASALLDAEYLARLSETRLTTVERERLQVEYQAKRAALPLQFRLVFVRPMSCQTIPQVILAKVLADVLAIWARDSEARRGVLSQQVQVLTPAILDGGASDAFPLLRTDLVRTVLVRIIRNVEMVAERPGAAVARVANGATFEELRIKLTDVLHFRLDPLVVMAGQSMTQEAQVWVTETIAAAERERTAAVGRAEAHRQALQQYSGASASPSAARATAPATPGSDVQTLSPQIDRTFIDRIVELSESNTSFRQDLTRSMIAAQVDAVQAEERVSYYRHLIETLRDGRFATMPADELDRRLSAVVTEAKALTQQFNDLYTEFSRISMRATAAMFQVEKPVVTQVYRGFTTTSLIGLVVAVSLVAFLAALVFLVVRDRLGRVLRAS